LAGICDYFSDRRDIIHRRTVSIQADNQRGAVISIVGANIEWYLRNNLATETHARTKKMFQ
jgi:hypothetical protein